MPPRFAHGRDRPPTWRPPLPIGQLRHSAGECLPALDRLLDEARFELDAVAAAAEGLGTDLPLNASRDGTDTSLRFGWNLSGRGAGPAPEFPPHSSA